MPFKKMQPTRPPRLWSLTGRPGSGKSTFAAQMRASILAVDADHRFAEVLHLVGGTVYQLSDTPADNVNTDAIACLLAENMPSSDVATIVVDSLTSIITPLVVQAMADKTAGRAKNLAAAFRQKALAMRQLQDGITRWGCDVLWIYHLLDARDEKAKEVVRATISQTELARLMRSINLQLEIVQDSDRHGVKVIWARHGRSGMTLWDAAWKRVGEAAVESALPALEKLSNLMDDISRYAEEHPEIVKAALEAGGLLVGIGALVKAASAGIRLYADWQMITAAATMFTASENMLAAAGIQQAATGGAALKGAGGLLGGAGGLLKGVAVPILSVLAGFEIVHQARNVMYRTQGKEAVGELETLNELWKTIRESASTVAGIGGGIAGALAGEDIWESYAYATAEVGKMLGLIEETDRAWDDSFDRVERLRAQVWNTRTEVQGLSSDLMQGPVATATGLEAFTEQELEAIDELESYLRRRNDLVEEHNKELARMEKEFLQDEEERYQEYLDRRAQLQAELRQVVEDPQWETTKEVRKAREKEAGALAEYQKRVAKLQEEHNKKMCDLKEDHDDRMEDLEARRDAKGILDERRRYGRAIRDENERHQEQLLEEGRRRDESIEEERQRIAEMREERKADIEEKLRELDESYAKESEKRQADLLLRMDEKRAQNAEELAQLEEACAERLASIMGWEETVREGLRKAYLGREADLREHLRRMEAMYREMYNLAGEPAQTPVTQVQIATEHGKKVGRRVRRRQAGGYADYGTYMLGEGGKEFVLNASTTFALERAIGSLSQAKIANLAGGSNSRLELVADINVRADPAFGPEFSAQIKSDVRKEVVRLAKHVASQQLGAHRSH